MKINITPVALLVLLSVSHTVYAQFPSGMQMMAGHKRSADYTIVRPRAVINQDITFSGQIAPIIWKNCVGCHRQGEVAPFTLTSYQDVVKRAGMVAAVTQSRYMPPWKPALQYGHFADARGLTQEEIDMIAQWAEAGAPEGDPSATPPLPAFSTGSQLGKPDLVLTMKKEWQVKGNNQDVYRNFVLPTELLQDKTIAAIEFRPGNPKVVHHALMYLDTTGTGRALDAEDSEYGYVGFGGPGFTPAKNMLGWVPGSVARFFPPGLGITMFKNSDLVVQIHYAPSATDEVDLSSINIFFSKQSVNREIQQAPISPSALVSGQFVIPANTTKKFVGRISGSSIPKDVSLLAVAPHMHLTGKNCKSYAITPKGDTIKLIQIDDWDFNWQGYYMVKNPVRIPNGSDLYYEAEYNNTTDNPTNPNFPPKELRWGEATSDEMFLCYYLYSNYRAGDENISMETQTPSDVSENVGNELAEIAKLSVYPNPVEGRSTIEFRVNSEKEVTLEISDVMGKILSQQQIMAAAGSNYFELPSLNFPAGVYYCRLRTTHGNVASSIFSVLR